MLWWQSLLWIFLIAGLFWSIYEKYDHNRKLYIDHSIFTGVYFLFSSAAIMVVQPWTINFFPLRPNEIILVIFTLLFSWLLYKWLRFFYRGPKEKFETTHHYFLLIDPKYIPSKFCEIVFQQVFIAAVISILQQAKMATWLIFIICTIIFILAHFSLFILQNKRIGEFYFKWSMVGAPIFILIILISQSLWTTIALHNFFYTLLSWQAWRQSHFKYPWLEAMRQARKK